MKRSFALILGALALAACDQSTGNSPEVKDNTFKANFVEACVKSASENGAPDAVSRDLCACASEKVLEEKGASAMTIPAEEANEILNQCARELRSDSAGQDAG